MTQPPSYPPQRRRSRGAHSGRPTDSDSASRTTPTSIPPRNASRPTSTPPSRPNPASPALPERHSVMGRPSASSQPPSYPPHHTRHENESAHASQLPPSYPPTHHREQEAQRPYHPSTPSRPRPTTPTRPAPPNRTTPPRSRRRHHRFVPVLIVCVLLIAWPLGLLVWANSKITHVEALSDHATTEGTTWLIAGSDRRSDGSDGGVNQPWVQGARTDTIIVVRSTHSQSAVVSLPRDTATQIPGYGLNKLNAAYSLGGPSLLVRTVEELTGVRIDHYVEVSMGGVTQIVDALGSVNLCSDLQVNDPESGLNWQPGCHDADGATALAFARMRKQDPQGDIGRQDRQRQVMNKITQKALSPSTLFNPMTQQAVAGSLATALVADPDTGVVSLGLLARAYHKAGKAELTGNPPISSMDYRRGGHGSMVLLDPTASPSFWGAFQSGTLQPSMYHHEN